jgi:hypothetical protein
MCWISWIMLSMASALRNDSGPRLGAAKQAVERGATSNATKVVSVCTSFATLYNSSAICYWTRSVYNLYRIIVVINSQNHMNTYRYDSKSCSILGSSMLRKTICSSLAATRQGIMMPRKDSSRIPLLSRVRSWGIVDKARMVRLGSLHLPNAGSRSKLPDNEGRSRVK